MDLCAGAHVKLRIQGGISCDSSNRCYPTVVCISGLRIDSSGEILRRGIHGHFANSCCNRNSYLVG